MGDRLQDLEERLGNLVPRGLSDDARFRIDQQIEELAAGVADKQPPGPRWKGALGVAAAAAIAVMGGLAVLARPGAEQEQGGRDQAGASVPADTRPVAAAPSEFEMVDYNRTVGDGKDAGIVLGRFNEPMRAWDYEVREMELLLDAKSGLKVQIVREGREQVQVAVTSF